MAARRQSAFVTAGRVVGPGIVAPARTRKAAIVDDLRRVLEANPDLDDAALTALCERAIRNHDPCISCPAHFLTLPGHHPSARASPA